MENEVKFQLEIKAPYRFLWIKYATAFRSDKHCLNCLIGGRSNIIPPASKYEQHYTGGTIYSGKLTEHPYRYIYLCGVTSNYNDNLHIIVKNAHGKSFTYEDNYCKVEFENAERVPIPPLKEGDVDRPENYWTCRNFQFGWHYLGETDLYRNMGNEEIAQISNIKKQ